MSSLVFLPKTHSLCLLKRELRQTPMEGLPKKHLTSTPQDGQGHEKQGKTEMGPQTRGDLGTRQLRAPDILG